jgi:hypothetical protein
MNSSLNINCPVTPIRRLGGHSRVQRLRRQRHRPARRREPCWSCSTDLALMRPTPSVDEPVRYFVEHSVRQTGRKSYIRWSSWSSVSSGTATNDSNSSPVVVLTPFRRRRNFASPINHSRKDLDQRSSRAARDEIGETCKVRFKFGSNHTLDL